MKKIGIDPGTKTGIAIWNTSSQEFILIETVKIHVALEIVLKHFIKGNISEIEVVCEDARRLGGSGVKEQGAGSIKRDCSIWEDFCHDHGIPIRFIRPNKRSLLKVDKDWFKMQIGWIKTTTTHSRDAAMLVWKM
jgi:hypothetical protein